MGTYTPSATYHSTLTTVDDGQFVNAAIANVGPKQLADNTVYLYSKLNPWIGGGTINPTGTVTIGSDVVIGNVLTVGALHVSSGFTINSTADFNGTVNMASALHVTGTINAAETLTLGGTGHSMFCNATSNIFAEDIRFPKSVALGGTGVATYQYASSSYDYIFSLNATIASGCVWQIQDTPTRSNVITFANLDTTALTLKNPAGSTILVLQNTSGNVYRATCAFVSSAWRVIDYAVRP